MYSMFVDAKVMNYESLLPYTSSTIRFNMQVEIKIVTKAFYHTNLTNAYADFTIIVVILTVFQTNFELLKRKLHDAALGLPEVTLPHFIAPKLFVIQRHSHICTLGSQEISDKAAQL